MRVPRQHEIDPGGQLGHEIGAVRQHDRKAADRRRLRERLRHAVVPRLRIGDADDRERSAPDRVILEQRDMIARERLGRRVRSP